WTGYSVVNPTVQSTKSAGPMAAAWAVLHFIGDDGYLDMARTMLDGTKRLIAGIEKIPALRMLGEPHMNLFAFASDVVSVFHVADEMRERGWYVQPQLKFGPSPENIHICVNPNCVQWVDDLLRDLAECVEKAKTMKSGELAASVAEMFGSMDPSALTPETFQQMLGMAGIQGSGLPTRMAEINEIMNALPPALRSRLLNEYFNELYHYRTPGA
ncbi:MAG: hypothetical protein KC466_19910, partial [Myxococcales bacterium]|nr:hypothetical protein [Myxococcales bacterium]